MSDSDYIDTDSDPTEDFFKPSFPPKTYKLTENIDSIKGRFCYDDDITGERFEYCNSFLEETNITPRTLVIEENDQELEKRLERERNGGPIKKSRKLYYQSSDPRFELTRKPRSWNNCCTVKGDQKRLDLIVKLERIRIQEECGNYGRAVLRNWLRKEKIYHLCKPQPKLNIVIEEEQPPFKLRNCDTLVLDPRSTSVKRSELYKLKEQGIDPDFTEYYAIKKQLLNELRVYAEALFWHQTRWLQVYDPKKRYTNPFPSENPNDLYFYGW